MSHRPSASGGRIKGSSRESQESRKYVSGERHDRPPPRGYGKQGNHEAYGGYPYTVDQGFGRPPPYTAETRRTETAYSTTERHTILTSSGLATSLYRGIAEPLHKDRDQLIHNFDRLRVAPDSYRRTNGEPRNDPGLAEHYYKTEAHFEQQREEAKYRHADINLRPADTNSAQPKRTQETRSQQPGLPYTEASPSMSRPSQNCAELRRPSYYSGKPEVSSTNTYRESLSPYSRKEMLDRSGTDSYQYKPLSSSRREEKPRSSRSGRYDDVDDNYDIRYKKPYKVAPPPTIKEELPDHYATLGISPDARLAEITIAAKKQRIKVHPDKCKNAAMSEAELKKIDEKAAQVGYAAEVLLDPEQKADYDRERRNAQKRNARVR